MKPIYPLFFLSLLFSYHHLSGQSLPTFFHYGSYKTFANPAIPFDGFNGYHNFNLNLTHRMEGAGGTNEGPIAQIVDLSFLPFNKNRFRLIMGGTFIRREFGPTNYIDGFFRLGAINYTSPGFGKLSAAINVGFNQFGLNARETQGLAPQDPLLSTNYANRTPNLGLGIFYKSEAILDRYELLLGFSIPQISSFDLVNYSVLDDAASTEINPQIYGTIGLNIYQGTFSYWELMSWVRKHMGEKIIVDFVGKYHLKKPAIWLGAGIASDKNMRTEFGCKLNYFSNKRYGRIQNKKQYFLLGFAYNFNWGNIPNQLNNGLELRLSWVLPQVRLSN